MPGIDLVLPDFSYLRERRRRASRRWSSPTATRTTPAASPSCCATCRCPSTARRSPSGLARNRVEEAGLADRAALRRGGRRRAPPDRALRRRVHPRHPLGAPRLRHRLPHPPGRDPALGGLQDRPHPGRRPAHRPGPHRRPGRRARASACCCRTRPTPRSPASPTPRRTVGATLRRLFAAHAGRRHHRHLLRQPHPPGPAGRRRRPRHGPEGRHPRPVHGQERRAGPAPGPARRIPDDACRRHRATSTTSTPGKVCVDLHRVPGRAACRRCR